MDFGTLVKSIMGASVMAVSGGVEGGAAIAGGGGTMSGFLFGLVVQRSSKRSSAVANGPAQC
jgi:hypothetical protein